MEIKIGAYNKDTRSVPVTFTSGDIVHKRDVNAVHNAKGAYDKAATKERVDQVGTGVANKIAAGAITNAPPPIVVPDIEPSTAS